MPNNTRTYLLIFLIAISFTFIVLKLEWFESLSVAIFLNFLIKFNYDLGNTLSVKNIIAIIASMQWLLGPVLGYYYNNALGYGYEMSIPKEEYFSYVLPATLFYFLGLYLSIKKQKSMLDFRRYDIDYYQKGMFLIIFGFIGGFLPLGFLAFILGGLKYVGLFYMFASRNPFKYYWIVPVFGFLVYSSLQGAMFHDLILWGSFFMMLYFLFRKSKFSNRLVYLSLGLAAIMLIQFVKSDYRSALRLSDGTHSNIELYWTVIKSKFNGTQKTFSDENIAANVVRVNQGWIISRVMQHVPANTPHANGKTIKDAIVASLLPRVVLPDKAVAGGRSNMENYAGIILKENTSMDISQVGEAYANFGRFGGIFFMFGLGLFFNWVIFFIEKKCIKYPDLVFWIPLIFLQAIKAETSLVTILNHVTKTALVTWFFFSPWGNYLINRFFYRKRVNQSQQEFSYNSINK